MDIIIVLAMHGAPPLDFPEEKMREFMGLHVRMEHAGTEDRARIGQRYKELDSEMRSWSRTRDNDPFFAGAQDMASHLRKTSGYEVIVGYNEFCGPSIDEAIDLAADQGADRIVVVTPMMTRGGGHAGKEIREQIDRSRGKHAGIQIIYAWPFESSDVAQFLSSQVRKFI